MSDPKNKTSTTAPEKTPPKSNVGPTPQVATSATGTAASKTPIVVKQTPVANPAQAIKVSNLEDGHISEKVQLILVTPYSDTVNKLKTIYEKDTLVQIHDIPLTQAASVARQLVPSFVMCSIQQEKDVIRILGFLKSIREEVRYNKIKFIVFSKVKNASVMKAFDQLGCKEYILEPVNERSLKFKIDLHLKALKAQRKSMRANALRGKDNGRSLKGDKKSGEEEHFEGSSSKVLEVDQKGTTDDLWIYKNKPKKQGKRWITRLKGPGEDYIRWVPFERMSDGTAKWRLVEAGKNLEETKKSAGWIFIGDKPVYNGDWNLAGEKPRLDYVDESGNVVSSKFWLDEKGVMCFSRDSQAAIKNALDREKREMEDRQKKKMGLYSGKGKKKEATELKYDENGNPIETPDEGQTTEDFHLENEKEQSSTENSPDYVMEKDERAGTEFNYTDKKEKKEGAHLDFEDDGQSKLEGGALDYTEETKKSGEGTELDYTEDKKSAEGADLNYADEEKAGAEGSDLNYSEENQTHAASDFNEQASTNDGKVEWPEDGELSARASTNDISLDPIPEIHGERKKVSYPLAPMVAVFFSEQLIRTKGNLRLALERFVGFISDSMGSSKVSLYLLKEEYVMVLASNNSKESPKQEIKIALIESLSKAIEENKTWVTSSSKGRVLALIKQSRDSSSAAIGVLVIDCPQGNFTAREPYFHSISQILRGVVTHVQQDVALLEEAEPASEVAA